MNASEAELRARLAELGGELADERAARQAGERALLEAIDSEQQRISQILHDTSSQSLSAARIYARVARDTIRRTCPDAAPAIVTLEEVIQTAADELQALTSWLRPAQLDGADLVDSLNGLAQLASRTVACEFRCSSTTIEADVASQAALLRLAQLALHALIRSRRGQAMAVELTLEQQHLVLDIHVSWADPLPSELEPLLDGRARLVGGTFAVQQRGDHGSTLTCRLPTRL